MDKKELEKSIRKSVAINNSKEFYNRLYGKLSGGQRRRADIKRALINTPKILFLDEPSTGLDPQTRKNIWQTIGKLQKENNMTVFLTTHCMEEAADADYVIVIDHGKIIDKRTPNYLKEKYSFNELKIKANTDIISKITKFIDKKKCQ